MAIKLAYLYLHTRFDVINGHAASSVEKINRTLPVIKEIVMPSYQ